MHFCCFVSGGKIADGVVDASEQCGCGIICDFAIIFTHAVFDPVQHDPYKAVFIQICDKNFLFIRDGKQAVYLKCIPLRGAGTDRELSVPAYLRSSYGCGNRKIKRYPHHG